MNLSKTSIVLILIVCLLAAGAAWAVNNWIESDHIIVDIEEYSITFNVNATLQNGRYKCVKGDVLLFNGTVTSDTFMLQYANVTLWCNSSYTGFWSLTDGDGYYEISYNDTDTIGPFDFYANATIT